jgi:hypothetical protein
MKPYPFDTTSDMPTQVIGGYSVSHQCTCNLCETGRKYELIISKLPEEEREWMSKFYNFTFEESAELDMYRAVYEKPHGHKLKT